MEDFFAAAAVTWFGVGRLPFAPGTWGSLAALPFAWILAGAGGSVLLAGAVLAVFLIGWGASAVHVRRVGVADPSWVVIDEVAGQWLALIGAPLDPLAYAVGFALFRAADILKPWPAGWADRSLKGGLGIMLDDLFAGAYALIGLQAFLFWSNG